MDKNVDKDVDKDVAVSVCILCVYFVCVLCGCCSMLLDKWRKEGSSPALHTSDGR